MSQHDTLLAAFEAYKAENEKFIEKGIKASRHYLLLGIQL